MHVEPIGWVKSARAEPIDDNWDSVAATITLDPTQFPAEALSGLSDFSHIEVIYEFDRVDTADIEKSARHPRGNSDWPKVGIFAQRAKARPNRIGVSTCHLLHVDGHTITVRGLDAIDGTPVLDIKPYMTEFAPRGDVAQPAWSHQVMSGYWTQYEEGRPTTSRQRDHGARVDPSRAPSPPSGLRA